MMPSAANRKEKNYREGKKNKDKLIGMKKHLKMVATRRFYTYPFWFIMKRTKVGEFPVDLWKMSASFLHREHRNYNFIFSFKI